MAKPLTKYSQSRSLESGQYPFVQDTEQVIGQGDARVPYTFSEWIQRNVAVVPGEEHRQYNNYLQRWYEEHREAAVTIATSIRNDYVALLQQLSLAFRDEAEEIWATDVNWDDPLEVQQVIPFYARKLKEIAIYIINKREAIRRAKLKYNMVGVRNSLERLFYEYLLKAFTKRRFPGNEFITNVTETSVFNALPELSAVASGFQIIIEELYDRSTYFDRDSRVPTSDYFNLTSETVSGYFDSIFGVTNPELIEWYYTTGVSQICADNPLLWSVDDVIAQYENGVPLSAVESPENLLLNDYNRIALTRKYLGENQFWVSGGYFTMWTTNVSWNFVFGNNWFYWLSGEHMHEIDARSIDPIMLTATNLGDVGTAGTSYKTSDLIFVSRNNQISGAWLNSVFEATATPTMSAKFVPGNYIFEFPFPDYGLSGEDLDWTGRGFSNVEPDFDYLSEGIQSQIQTLYWSSTSTSISSFEPVYIYDSGLIEGGAHPDVRFDLADQLIVRSSGEHDSTPDGVYTGQQEYAWLYRMDRTDVPVATGENKIYWPFFRYTESDVPVVALTSQCAPLPLSAVDIGSNMVGAVAGDILDVSDVIYKLNSPDGTAIEAAWLSGRRVSFTGLVSGASQPSLAFYSDAATYTTFIWEGPTVPANQVFGRYQHQDDCDYLKEDLINLYRERPSQGKDLDYNQWEKCTCRAIFYSPLGHKGERFDDYDRMADYIARIDPATEFFNFASWTDRLGRPYDESDEFGWYQLTAVPYGSGPDVEWGNGTWSCGRDRPYTSNVFYLSSGQIYTYFRSHLNRDQATDAPYFVKKYSYHNGRQKWIKAIWNDTDNKWESANVPTDMVIRPGDYLMYDHRSTRSFGITSLDAVPATQTYRASALNQRANSTEPSVWTNWTYGTTGQNLVYQWPSEHSAYGPRLVATDLSAVSWYIYTPFGEVHREKISPSLPVTIEASLPGPYIATAEAYGNPGAGQDWGAPYWDIPPRETEIPIVTAVRPELSQTFDTITDLFFVPSVNMVLNVSLSGWNYTQSRYDGVSLGARPYWATATDLRNDTTRQKGISKWGGNLVPTDRYNFTSQPDFSTIVFSNGVYVEYIRIEQSPMIWVQPLTLKYSIYQPQWKKLLIDPTKSSTLHDVIFTNSFELVVSATNETSDIVFDQQDEPLLVNYYALNNLTWTQELSDSSLGIPPTGGVWVPIASGDLITPLTPYAYLTNRHYPTYATAPYVGDLYSVSDTGGYFVTRMLGADTFVGKDYQNVLNTEKLDPIEGCRGIERIFRNDVSVYRTDYGLSRTDQLTPVSTISIDSGWMKASITEWSKSGMIVGAVDHSEFIPYQTKYETMGRNDNGIRRQGDAYDPWTGRYDDVWDNPTDWPPNWRKQYPITDWFSQLALTGVQLYQWKTDIFGNQYGLYKDTAGCSIYDKRQALGSIWTRDGRNVIRPASVSMSEVYSRLVFYNSALNVELSSGIRDFDIWYDTMMIYTSSSLLFARLTFDYEENTIGTIADNTFYVDLRQGRKFGGTWFFEEDKRVTVSVLCPSAYSGGMYYYPVLYDLDLDNNTMEKVFDGSTDFLYLSSYALQLCAIEDPVFTYNFVNHRYDIAFIAQSTLPAYFDRMIIGKYNIVDLGREFETVGVTFVTPTCS